MNEAGRKKVVVCLFAAWALLLAFLFVEDLGYFHDTDEYADQSIEQTLSSPVITTYQNLDRQLAALAFIGFISITVFVIQKSAQPFFQPLTIIQELSWPPGFPKIYQLISTYRI